MGIAGDHENPKLIEAYVRTIAAYNKHGNMVGVGGLHARMDLIERFCRLGTRWIMAAADGSLLIAAATKKAAEMAGLNSILTGATNGNQWQIPSIDISIVSGARQEKVLVRVWQSIILDQRDSQRTELIVTSSLLVLSDRERSIHGSNYGAIRIFIKKRHDGAAR